MEMLTEKTLERCDEGEERQKVEKEGRKKEGGRNEGGGE